MPHEVIMPALGMAQDTGKLVNWIKNEGDEVKTGDVLFEVETDKSTMEVDAQADGYLSAISANAGDDVPVGNVIALISDEPGAAASVPQNTQAAALEPAPESETKPEPQAKREPAATATPAAPAAAPVTGKILASPKARLIASKMGLDLAGLAEAGHPQPYHVSDIEVLKALPPAGKPQAEQTTQAGDAGTPLTMPCFIALEAKTKGVKDFLEWMQTDGNITLETSHVWASYAAACLRNAKPGNGGPLTLAVGQMNGESEFYVDADKQRLSKMVTADEHAAPDLVIKDITGSQFSQMRLGAAEAPVLTIAKVKKHYLLSLEFTAQQMNDDEAIGFMTDFCGRLNDPLKHVL